MAGGMDDVFANIMSDYQAIAAAAIKSAAKKAQADIVQEADRYLRLYYSSYKPSRYKRTNQLKNAIKPIFIDKSSGSNIDITIGIEYSADALIGKYHSNSWYHQSGTHWIDRSSGDFDFDSQNNGIPQPEWILENFLTGVHQWGDGSNEKFEHSESSTNTLMQEFFNVHLPKRIDEYMQNELINVIASKL